MSSSTRSNALAPQHLQRDAAVLGRRDAVALQLQAAREQQAVDLVVVDDQQAGAARWRRSRMAQLRQRRRDARVLGLPARRAARRRAAATLASAGELQVARQRRQRQRAERVAVRLERMRGAPERARRRCAASARRSSASIAGASCEERVDQLERRTRRRRSPGARRTWRGRSSVRSSSVLRGRARWFSASTSRSTRIGLVR